MYDMYELHEDTAGQTIPLEPVCLFSWRLQYQAVLHWEPDNPGFMVYVFLQSWAISGH